MTVPNKTFEAALAPANAHLMAKAIGDETFAAAREMDVSRLDAVVAAWATAMVALVREAPATGFVRSEVQKAADWFFICVQTKDQFYRMFDPYDRRDPTLKNCAALWCMYSAAAVVSVGAPTYLEATAEYAVFAGVDPDAIRALNTLFLV